MTPASPPQVRVIQTRYRDVDRSVIVAAHGHLRDDGVDWETLRGKPLAIETPPFNDDGEWCGEHWYAIAGKPGWWVCPHIAEIGD